MNTDPGRPGMQDGMEARGAPNRPGMTDLPFTTPEPAVENGRETYNQPSVQPLPQPELVQIYTEDVYPVEEYYDDYEYAQPPTMVSESWQTAPSMPQILMIVLTIIMVLGLVGWWQLNDRFFAASSSSGVTMTVNEENFSGETQFLYEGSRVEQVTASGEIAPFFAPSVQYWEPQILQWSERHNLDPNMVATIMQIESCGDPQAVSIAGATGLFQVMPFHFETGENAFDPETNALRGMNYFAERLVQTGGDVGKAFAGYNGGHVAAGTTYDNWVDETQRYYRWSTGIYGDAVAGSATSETLDAWFAAGGTSLCTQAEQRLGIN